MKTEISKYSPCKEALKFRLQYDNFEDAWNNCPRGDWMLWIAERVGVNRRKLTLAKGYCAKTVIHLMGDERSVNAVKVAIRYGRYRADDSELNDAAYAAYAAYVAYAAAAAAASYASYVAAAAVNNASYTAYAASYASYASYVAAAAVNDASYAAYTVSSAADDEKENQKQTADICRKYLTKDVFKLIKK